MQLHLACQDAGADTYWFGTLPHELYRQHYPQVALEGRQLQRADFRGGDVLIGTVPGSCDGLLQGRSDLLGFLYLLGPFNIKPDICGRIAHNHWLQTRARLPDMHAITPYMSPWFVRNAADTVGLQADGSFADAKVLIELKYNWVFVDDMANMSANMLTRLQRSLPPWGHLVVSGIFSRSGILKIMPRAKVVLHWCMEGSERTPIEAALHGAVFITNACDTGGDAVDFPLTGRHRVTTEKEMHAAVRRVLDNYIEELHDPGQIALRRKYAHTVGRASMAREAAAFLRSLEAPAS